MDIVEILKVGFSGFAFLLAWLAYRLLAEEQRKSESRKSQLKAIYNFMAFSIILGMFAMISPFIPKMLENEPDPFMQAMLESAKNRKPLPLEFVKSQIQELTIAHNERLVSLYMQREKEEGRLSSRVSEPDIRQVESTLRRLEQYIREENRSYESKVREFRNML